MKTKLIRDPWNSERWQAKYFDVELMLWFDLGPAFPATKEGREDAEAWLKDYIEEEKGGS